MHFVDIAMAIQFLKLNYVNLVKIANGKCNNMRFFLRT